MNLKKTKIFKVITSGNRESILKTCQEYLKSGKDTNLRNPDTGGNLLHHMVSFSHKFTDPEMLTAVYMLACMEVEIDAQDFSGDTALHCVVRQRGAHRLMIALIRCGIDTSIQNSAGMTAEDILRLEKPPGHEEMLHWYHKFKPGLWCALMENTPDQQLIERLLRSWCRLTTVKNGEVVNMKSVIQHDPKYSALLCLLEKYENTVELALALLAGMGPTVRKWIQEGTLHDYDVGTMDISHQFRYPDYPSSPLPLLIAAWETNSFEVVDTLMDLKPDTCQLFGCGRDNIPIPVIFHLFDSPFRPKELRTIHRILECTDVSIKNYLGQTLLFQAIATEESLETVNILLRKGISVGARDNLGRTARDLAEGLERKKYMQGIDNHVLQLVKCKDFTRVESLLLEGYDHLIDLTDGHGRNLAEFANKFSSRDIYEIVRLGDEIQNYVRRVFQAVDEGSHDDLSKLLSCTKYAAGRDVCGRTPLLKAILQQRRGLVMKLVTHCSFTINMQDSLGRSALHYANLFMDDPDMMEHLTSHGANPHLTDVLGRHPRMYNRYECGLETFAKLQREVLDADLDIYIFRTNFDSTIRAAIRAADLAMVKHLVTGLAQNGEVSRFSSLLFLCVDLCREDIALYLLNSGFRSDIWKQYYQCDPTTPPCATGECSHTVISLKQRATETGCTRVVKFIN